MSLVLNSASKFHSCYTATDTYLKSSEVFGKEVIRRTATPVHYVFVLTATAKFAVPVGDTEVCLDKSVTHRPVPQHSVEEGLGREEEIKSWEEEIKSWEEEIKSWGEKRKSNLIVH